VHQTTALWGGTCLLVLGFAITGLFKFRGEHRLPAVRPLLILFVAICLGGLVGQVFTEISLTHRDNAMRAQLAAAGIEMVEVKWDDDNLVIVRAKECTAEFQIKQNANPGAWPIISGTGKAVSGCDSKDLDKTFIRP
jgi:hypothetical protein